MLFIALYYRQFSADIKMINILTSKPLLEFCLFLYSMFVYFLGLELPVLGEETYLLEPDLKFPNLEQINLKVQVTLFPV